MFDFIYTSGNRKALGLNRDEFFNLVEKRVGQINFDPTKPLNLNNMASSSAYTDPVKEMIREIERQVERLAEERERKEVALVTVRREGNEKRELELLEDVALIQRQILRLLEEKERYESELRKMEREMVFDLFNPPSDEPPPKPDRLSITKLKARAMKAKLNLMRI